MERTNFSNEINHKIYFKKNSTGLNFDNSAFRSLASTFKKSPDKKNSLSSLNSDYQDFKKGL